MSKDSKQIAVVGAGIAGLSAVASLAQLAEENGQNITITLMETGDEHTLDYGTETTGASYGTRTSRAMGGGGLSTELVAENKALYQHLQAILDEKPEVFADLPASQRWIIKPSPSFYIAPPEGDKTYDKYKASLEEGKAARLSGAYEEISGAELKDRYPAFAKAQDIPADAKVLVESAFDAQNPKGTAYTMNVELAKAILKEGFKKNPNIDLQFATRLQQVQAVDGKAVTTDINGREQSFDKVILANGPDMAHLVANSGGGVDLRPARVVYGSIKNPGNHAVPFTKYNAKEMDLPAGCFYEDAPDADGNIPIKLLLADHIGDTSEMELKPGESVFADQPSEAEEGQLKAAASKLFGIPENEVVLNEARVCTYNMTPDSKMLIGPIGVAGVENPDQSPVLALGGFNSGGARLAAGAAEIAARKALGLTQNVAQDELDAINPNRAAVKPEPKALRDLLAQAPEPEAIRQVSAKRGQER